VAAKPDHMLFLNMASESQLFIKAKMASKKAHCVEEARDWLINRPPDQTISDAVLRPLSR